MTASTVSAPRIILDEALSTHGLVTLALRDALGA
jgi:hypothetical protein